MVDPTSLKPVDKLTVEDFSEFPVWEFADDDESVDGIDSAEVLVRPVTELPILNAVWRFVATQVRLANGKLLWATLGNLSLNNYDSTKQFLGASIYCNDSIFHLARYHDGVWELYGPAALSRFLGMDIEDVFPISYDVSDVCVGDPRVIRGSIAAEPTERLSKSELRKLRLRD